MGDGVVDMIEIISKESLGVFFIIMGFYAVVIQLNRLKLWVSIVLGVGFIFAGLILSGV